MSLSFSRSSPTNFEWTRVVIQPSVMTSPVLLSPSLVLSATFSAPSLVFSAPSFAVLFNVPLVPLYKRPSTSRAHEVRYYRHEMLNRLSMAALAAALTVPLALTAQDRLKTMPGYDAAQRMAREAPAAVSGAVTGVTWIEGGRAFEYDRGGKRYRYDLSRERATEIAASSAEGGVRTGRGRGGSAAAPDRG